MRIGFAAPTVVLTALAIAGCSDDVSLEIGPRGRSSPALVAFDSCDELTAALRAHVKEEMRVRLLQTLTSDSYYRGGGPLENAATPGEAAGDSQGGLQEGVDYSGTNNQEAGVDEADFVKTDGYHIYLLNGDRLEILGVPAPGQLEAPASATIEGYPLQMLVGDDRAVVFSSVSTWNLPAGNPLATVLGASECSGGYGCWYPISTLTKLTVLDISDRGAPTVLHELYLEGWYQTARKADSTVRMVSYAWMMIPGLQYWPEPSDGAYASWPVADSVLRDAVERAIAHNDAVIDATPLAALVPQIYELAGGSIAARPFTDDTCNGFSMAEDAASHGFTSILSLDLLGESFSFDAEHVMSNQGVVYASTDTLLIAERAQDWWWYWDNDAYDEATNIHRFDISGAGLATYTGSGRVDGTVLDQFSLSELDGVIRVAATTGQWNRFWVEDPPPPENHVYTLRGEDRPRVIGHLGGIAVGERIWSARFTGDLGFLVTFRNMDPLWTIDLSDPTAPRILGELNVPGVSTYIHPVDDQHLLTIGFGGDDSGLDWTTQLSLFDVSDFTEPAVDATLSLAPPAGDGWVYAWSEALYEHKAFQFWPALSMLAVPVSTYRYDDGSYDYYAQLDLVDVDTTGGLTLYTTVDHSDFFNAAGDTYWYNHDIRRSIFMTDGSETYIYAVSDLAVTATRISDKEQTAAVELSGGITACCWGY